MSLRWAEVRAAGSNLGRLRGLLVIASVLAMAPLGSQAVAATAPPDATFDNTPGQSQYDIPYDNARSGYSGTGHRTRQRRPAQGMPGSPAGRDPAPLFGAGVKPPGGRGGGASPSSSSPGPGAGGPAAGRSASRGAPSHERRHATGAGANRPTVSPSPFPVSRTRSSSTAAPAVGHLGVVVIAVVLLAAAALAVAVRRRGPGRAPPSRMS